PASWLVPSRKAGYRSRVGDRPLVSVRPEWFLRFLTVALPERVLGEIPTRLADKEVCEERCREKGIGGLHSHSQASRPSTPASRSPTSKSQDPTAFQSRSCSPGR